MRRDSYDPYQLWLWLLFNFRFIMWCSLVRILQPHRLRHANVLIYIIRPRSSGVRQLVPFLTVNYKKFVLSSAPRPDGPFSPPPAFANAALLSVGPGAGVRVGQLPLRAISDRNGITSSRSELRAPHVNRVKGSRRDGGDELAQRFTCVNCINQSILSVINN